MAGISWAQRTAAIFWQLVFWMNFNTITTTNCYNDFSNKVVLAMRTNTVCKDQICAVTRNVLQETGKKKVSQNVPERFTGPRGRFGTVYSPFSAKTTIYLSHYFTFTVNCLSTTLFFCKLPSRISLKFNNTIAMFSIKLNYSHPTFKWKVHFIYSLERNVISTPPASPNTVSLNTYCILFCFQMYWRNQRLRSHCQSNLDYLCILLKSDLKRFMSTMCIATV